ncbi:MAG: class I SAM-dependent methyltransferase [Bacteriovoracia bacterium]
MYDRAFAERTIASTSFAKLASNEAAFIKRAAGFEKGASILDVPCGTGRHARALGRLGMQVTALDINRTCLSLARARFAHANVKYRQGDMAKLAAYRDHFDGVVNLFTSFGYFDTDARNRAVLMGMVRTLKRGGKLVLHTINRTYWLEHFQPNAWRVDGDWISVEARHYDAATKYHEAYLSSVNNRTGRGAALYHRIRLYSPEEMIDLMRECGLSDIQVYGNARGGKLEVKRSTHPFYIGTRY